MRLLSFETDHINFDDIREHEALLFSGMSEFQKNLHKMKQKSKAWTLLDKVDNFVACFGVTDSEEGYLEYWLIPSKDFGKYLFKVCRLAKEITENLVTDNPEHTLRCHCLDDLTHNKWMRFLGFKRTGFKKGYGMDGQDFNVWERNAWE